MIYYFLFFIIIKALIKAAKTLKIVVGITKEIFSVLNFKSTLNEKNKIGVIIDIKINSTIAR